MSPSEVLNVAYVGSAIFFSFCGAGAWAPAAGAASATDSAIAIAVRFMRGMLDRRSRFGNSAA